MNEERRADQGEVIAMLARLDERTKLTHETVGKIEKRMGDHDKRIRTVEGSSKKWAGAAVVGGGVIGWLSKYFPLG